MQEADLDLLKDAVATASKVALTYSGPQARKWEKSGEGPVTEADIAVNDALETHLRAARPEYGWISEESPADEARLSRDRLFVIDPIDGTRSFIEGSGTWAISVAVIEAGRPIAGIVALPARDMVFTAALGGGAYCNDEALNTSQRSDLSGADMLVPRPALDPKFWPGGVPDVTRHHRPSLAYRLCLAARGRFDAMLTLRDTWEWDIAAGALIATEAGCVVSDRNGAAPRFNSPKLKSKGVVVANAALHGEIVKRLSAA